MTTGGLESKCFLVYRDYILTNLLFFPRPSGGVGLGRGNFTVEDRVEGKGADTGSALGDTK